MTDTEDRLIGQTIDGRFRLDRLIGAGGMGKVYHGLQLSVGRTVAVKVLRSDLSEIPSLQQRFLREAQVLASIHHPNIVGLVDFGRDEGLGALYMVMQYVDGRSLTELVSAGRLPLGVSLAIARQICSGLAEAHGAGVVHRDLKPDNVMLQTTAEGALVAKILDFGIALPTGKDETRFTSTGAIVGSPYYMSPEQAQDMPVGPRADLYALGVMLYEMIAGVVPFSADTPLAVLYKTVNERHTPIQELLDSPRVRGPVADLLDELLEKDPQKRPASASELARRLDELRAGLDVPPLGDVQTLDTLIQPAVERRDTRPDVREPGTSPESDAPFVGTEKPPSQGIPTGVLAFLLFILVGVVLLVAMIAGGIFIVKSRAAKADAPVAESPTTEQPADAAPAPEPTARTDERLGDAGEATALPAEEPAAAETPAPAPQKPGKTARKAKKKKSKRNKLKGKLDKLSGMSGSCQNRECAVSLKSRNAHYACQNANCVVDCPGGGCSQVCQAGSTCRFECRGGGCSQSCFDGTTCTVSCSGGSCERTSFGDSMTELD